MSPEAKKTISEFLKLHKIIDKFSGCEVRTQKNLFAPGLNMMVNQLHLNNPNGREAYARQYQRTLLDWDAAEVTKVPEATKKTLERGKILFNVKVIVNDLKTLKDMLNLEKNLWVGVKFCVVNAEMPQSVQRMLPKHVVRVSLA